MKQLDLSSYSEPVTQAEIAPYLKTMLKPTLGKIFVIGVAVIMTGLLISAFLDAQVPVGTFFVLGIVLIAALVLTAAIYRMIAVNRVLLSRMAERNGVELTLDEKDPDLNGMYFQAGYDRKIIEQIYIPEDGIAIGVHQYTTGSGKNRQTHMVGFARCTVTRVLPHMVLDNTKNNVWKISNLPVQFDRDQKLSLEGDFNNYFTLYAPEEYERDALYIFTPDVMAAFVDSGYTIDAEIIDNNLYLYCENSPRLTNEKFLNTLYGLIQSIGDKLERQSDYYKDERVESRAANIVAPAGKRLKTSYSLITLLVIGSFIFIQIFNFWGTKIQWSPYSVGIILITLSYGVIWYRNYIKSSKDK